MKRLFLAFALLFVSARANAQISVDSTRVQFFSGNSVVAHVTKLDTALVADTGVVSAPSIITDPCLALAHSRVVNVTTTTALINAINAALPGDLIHMAQGNYTTTGITITRSGTSLNRISICGPKLAVIDRGTKTAGNGLTIKGVSYLTLKGFTVTQGITGVYVENGHFITVDSLTVHDVGQELVRFHVFSTHNTIRHSNLYNSGIVSPQFGEGVYLGTAPTQWATYTGGAADKSDSNTVVSTTVGPNIGSDPVDIKAGVVGTVVDSNYFDGTGEKNFTNCDTNWCGGFIINNAQNTIVRANTGYNPPLHGFSVQSDGGAPSNPATGTVYKNNYLNLNGASGAGFLVGSGLSGSTTVYCTSNTTNGNKVVNAGSFSNVSCTP